MYSFAIDIYHQRLEFNNEQWEFATRKKVDWWDVQCTYIRIYIYMHICIHICIYIYIYIHIYMCMSYCVDNGWYGLYIYSKRVYWIVKRGVAVHQTTWLGVVDSKAWYSDIWISVRSLKAMHTSQPSRVTTVWLTNITMENAQFSNC